MVRESPDLQLFVLLAGSKLKVYRNAETLAELEVGAASAEAKVRERLEQLCEGKHCTSEVTLDPDAPLVPTLLAWQRVFGNREQTLKILPLPVAQRKSDAPPPATGQEKKASGRLPPEEIQSLVRDHFSLFRGCYEAGLARNARLMGLVSVRFVIEPDGTVSDARDFGSNLPDLEARACVVRAFTDLKFKPPSGGVVTVVYPIMLMPN
jgi:hypothetical protein